MVNPDLWNKTTWMNPNIDFLFGTDIKEYDMKAAAYNLSREFNLLSEDKIQILDKMDKSARNKQLGLYQRDDKTFTKNLKDAFVEARKWFIETNDLGEDEILTIKKDAIFVIDKKIKHTTRGYIQFDTKNAYTSFFKLNKLEFYFHRMKNIIHIKGLGQDKEFEKILEHHGDYMLNFLMMFIKMKEKHMEYSYAAYKLSDFIRKYRNRQLPIEYYRELSRKDAYRIAISGDDLYVDETKDTKSVDIIYNYINYIVPLVSLYI